MELIILIMFGISTLLAIFATHIDTERRKVWQKYWEAQANLAEAQDQLDSMQQELLIVKDDLDNAKRVNELQEASLEHLKRDKNRSSIRRL